MEEVLDRYFEKARDLETLIAQSQLLQSEGYKCIFEEARRQKPYCSMAINWCFNEPWPTAANNSLVNWPHIPKPALESVGQSCRPILASARIPKFTWKPGETFRCKVGILNDSPHPMPGGEVVVKLAAAEETILFVWPFGDLPPNTNKAGPEVFGAVPKSRDGRFRLILEVPGHPEWNSSYTLLNEKPKEKP